MSYKYSKGFQVIGDLKAADDAQRNTVIDFGEDQIEFQTSGSTRMTVSNQGVQVTGLMIGDEYSLPDTDGSADQVIKTDGSGNLSFATVSGGGGGGSPGGSDTQVQINNGGSFGGLSGLTYDGDTLFVSSSLQLVGEEKINDPSYASGEQANRSFTLKRHYNFSNVSANTWHDVISFQPFLEGTTNNPNANTFWASIGMKIEIGGHTSGVGNGYRSRTAFVSYNGSSADSGGSSDITLGTTNVSTRLNLSGWSTTVQINPNQANATGFSGTVYVEIHFGRGAGASGESITWSIT